MEKFEDEDFRMYISWLEMTEKKVCMILKRNFELLKKDSRVLRECDSLIKAGYAVSVVIFGDESSKTYEKINGIDVKITRIKNMKMAPHCNQFKKVDRSNWSLLRRIICFILFSHLYALKYFYNTLLMLLCEDADVYHAHDLETLLLGYAASRIKNSKLIYDSHELGMEIPIFNDIINKIKKPYYGVLEKYIIKKVDAVLTVNESLAQHLVKSYEIEKPVVLHNYPGYNEYKGKSNMLRDKLSINENTKVVLYQGGLMSGRGLENLIDCAKHLNDNIIIVLMGYGGMKKSLQQKIDLISLHDKIKILDAVSSEDLIEYTASADLGVSPIQNICLSYYYSTPNKVWEYIIAGIPFVASDFPEMRKLAVEENMGAVFNPEDPKSIADAINNLLENPEIYEIKKRNVLRFAEKKYNWEKESSKLLKAYNDLKLIEGIKLKKYNRI